MRRGCPALVYLMVLAGCAGATTMRVDHENGDEESSGESGVTIAPAATVSPDSGTRDSAAFTPDGQQPAAGQGYAGYGGPAAIAIRRIGQWSHTGIGESRRLVIRDPEGWTAFWSELGVGERPAVDFTRDAVIAVAAGQRRSGGYEIAVSQVSDSAGELTIEVLETSPGPECSVAAALSQPVDVVVVPAVKTQRWSFVEQQLVRSCR
jgi:protease stability complex PrcB-like protein